MSILSHEAIQHRAPSVFAQVPSTHVSPNYRFVNTGEVVSMLEDAGWGVFNVAQQKVRNYDKRLGTKHIVTLRRRNDSPAKLQLGGLLPSIHLVNSHDWSSRFEVLLGMLRLVCSNGMMVQGAGFDAYSLRHDKIMEDMQTVMAKFASNANKMLEMAELWARIRLSDPQAIEFARMAAILRFGDDANHLKLLHQRRSEDLGSSLWNVFNVIQENVMVGGFKVNKRRSRPIANIAATRDLNVGLFQLASTFAPHELN